MNINNENNSILYKQILSGIENGLLKMKDEYVPIEEFNKRLEKFKHFNYLKLSDDEIFWILTYVMFFNMGKKASMIEAKLPLFKKYLYGYKNLALLPESDIENIIKSTGFNKQVHWCIENSKEFEAIINNHGSFQKYISTKFGIVDTYCSNQKLNMLYTDLKNSFVGIGETAGWHFLTELGFNSLKPDTVIRRLFYRLGLIDNQEDMNSAIEVGRKISKDLNIPIRYIDIIFVKYGQVGHSNLLGTKDGICTENNPKCHICDLKKFCKYSLNELSKPGDVIKDSHKVPYTEHKESNNNPHTVEKDFPKQDKFKSMYDKSSIQLKTLFNELVKLIDEFDIKNFATNTPDYRLQKKYNFCLIKFLTTENALRIHLKLFD
jgi:DNA-3-methyladenine glycosylase I